VTEQGAFLSQLAPPGYVLDLGPSGGHPGPGTRAADPAGGPGDPGDGPAEPGVLLLSRSRDPGLDGVARLLGRAGVAWARLDVDDLAGAGLLADPRRRAVRVRGRWLAPTVTWVRHFTARAARPGAPAAEPWRMFARDSWHAAAAGLAALSGVCLGASRPGLLAQLDTAARHGIAVPATVVGTDPAQAARLLAGPRLVVKALHEHFVEAAPGRLHGIFPVIVPRGTLAGWPAGGPPVVVQEYVEHEAELRVYYLDGQVHGFAIGKDAPADPWLRPERVSVAPATVPPAVTAAATALSGALGLRYGAIDFLIRDGQPVFLEVNPAGDWHWAETRAGVAPVTLAAARMLCDLHRAQVPGGPAAGRPWLLGFLAG
jgi:hypothetical protein